MGNVGEAGETGKQTLEETLELAKRKIEAAEGEILSPRKQVAQGIAPEDVICKEGLELVFKSTNNSPACVNPQTVDKLIERGWALSNQSVQEEQTFDFAKSKKSVLSDLVKIEQSHKFDIVFDEDLTSKQKEGAIFHTYKIIHETDGWIGDLSFYSGKPYLLMFPSSDFDEIFRVKIFISTEYGVSPTSVGLPIIKSSLEELVPEWNMINKDQTSSDWIDAVIQYSQSDSSGEKTETIRSDQQEIKFALNDKGGFVELIITQKIS